MHSNETWQSSQCLEREETAVGTIHQHLSALGYQTTNNISHTRSIWQHGRSRVVVSLVDDAWDCAEDRGQDTPYLFDADTTIITDNWINTPTVYQVAKLPDSFYGIYSYVPADQTWTPDRDYAFGVNRLEFKRMQLLLNLYHTLGVDRGYVNFNCEVDMRASHSVAQVQQHFLDQLVHANPEDLKSLNQLAKHMPIKNYTIHHDQIYTRSWLNIIVETYSSDNVIALSEKIFRCLVTPVPWIAFSGRYTIARLRSLGFDVLDDVVDHCYDRLIEAHHKMSVFANTANTTIANLKTHEWHQLKQRCLAAAQHNQQLLSIMRDCWNNDFSVWLSKNTL
jgi:hypothetical protein